MVGTHNEAIEEGRGGGPSTKRQINVRLFTFLLPPLPSAASPRKKKIKAKNPKHDCLRPHGRRMISKQHCQKDDEL